MKRLFAPGFAGLMIMGAASAQAPQNTTTTFKYDAAGNLAEVTNGLQHVRTFKYDAHGRQTLSIDPNTGVETTTGFGYDLLDQLISVRDARNVMTEYQVDGLGNLKKTISGDTGETVSTYDEAGNLKTRTDAKLQRTTFEYDALNRVTLISYHDGSSAVYLYDQQPSAVGKISRITDIAGQIDYAYDAFGRLQNETRTIGGGVHIVTYGYDEAGRMNSIRYPSGRTVDYGFDAQGRVNKITSTQGTIITPILNNVTYQPFGPIKAITFGNDRTQARTYDLDGRMSTFSLSSQTMKIGYDAASRLTSMEDLGNSANATSYGYDLMDRLSSVTTQSSAQTYEYDAVGNRKLKINNGSPTTYTYGTGNNRLTQVGPLSVPADPNGSITGKPNATFEYDARGRMAAANTMIGKVRYTINSLGQRVQKIAPTETTVFHYDFAGKLIAETTTVGATTRTQEYIYLGDLAVAVLK